ncbi:helix-turn-helix domain-containing protein [Bremerella cremea]|uniref:AraC family transcriptional regulator n=1 Tax=Bremerella cremea TaxID=1031537 RepID=UPI0018F3CB97
MEGHLQNDLSLETIAAACHVSPYHLTRAFAATTGVSLMRYVRDSAAIKYGCPFVQSKTTTQKKRLSDWCRASLSIESTAKA